MRHWRDKHRININDGTTIEGNDIEESNEVNLATDGGFDIADVEKDLEYLNFFEYLKKEDEEYRDFMTHLNKDNIVDQRTHA